MTKIQALLKVIHLQTLAAAHGRALAPPTCKFVADTDFQPGGVGSGAAATAEICCRMCLAKDTCAAAAWNGPEYKTCYMKDKFAKPKHTPGTTGCIPNSKPVPALRPHPPKLLPPGADQCVTVQSGNLALCIGFRSGRVRNATLGGQPLALSSWAGPIECNGLNDTSAATVRSEPSGSVYISRTVCSGGGVRAAPGCPAPAQPGMGLSGGDLNNLQLAANASADACADACCATLQCTGWTYLPSGQWPQPHPV